MHAFKNYLSHSGIALVGACLYAATAQGSNSDGDDAFVNGPPPGPVVVIGIDGMTYDVLDPLIAAGRVPHLAALIGDGARVVLRSESPTRSPALWTTVVTGQPRAVHGIYDFVTGSRYWPAEDRSQQQKLVTSDMRKAPALWQFVGQAGRRSLVVGWLNTWPAERIRGVMVAPYVALGSRRQTSIKGKVYDDAPDQTYPRETFKRIKRLLITADRVPSERLAQIVDAPPAGSPLYEAVGKLKRYLYTVRWSVGGTLSNTAIVEDQLAHAGPFDLVMTYFDGADTLAHRFWLFRQDLASIERRLAAHAMPPKLAAPLKKKLGRVVDNYYVLADEMVGRLRAAAGPQATVIIVSDHGWGDFERDRAISAHVPFDGQHLDDGVLIAAGPHIRRGYRGDELNLYHVTPTVLYAMGLGVPESLPNKPALQLFTPGFVARHPGIALARSTAQSRNEKNALHGRRSRQAPAATPDRSAPFRETELERLRSLGYVQ